jgi:Cu+-exporting ATPase
LREEDRSMARDPVCGMEVDEESAAGKAEHEGRVNYFCSEGCKKAFLENPAKFSQSNETSHKP